MELSNYDIVAKFSSSSELYSKHKLTFRIIWDLCLSLTINAPNITKFMSCPVAFWSIWHYTSLARNRRKWAYAYVIIFMTCA